MRHYNPGFISDENKSKKVTETYHLAHIIRRAMKQVEESPAMTVDEAILYLRNI